jgi:hypothetical protein
MFSTFLFSFFSNVQLNKTLAISILMKYSTETPTTMSDKVSIEWRGLVKAILVEKLMSLAENFNNFSLFFSISQLKSPTI